MDDLTRSEAHGGEFALLVKWLGEKDEQRNQTARARLSRLGRPGTMLLIDEAVGPGKQPDHRIAILDVVARIGEPLGLDEFLKLRSLLHHRVPRVAAKAEEVFATLSSGGVPDSPEAVALFRAFHPAFWTLPRRPRKPSVRRERKQNRQRWS